MQPDFNPYFQDMVLKAEMREDGVSSPFFTLTARDLLTKDFPPRVDLLGEAIIYEHGLSSLVAPPGTGKSRAVIQMAVVAILGLKFGPLQGHGTAKPWLFLSGNENSRHRYRSDLQGLFQHLTPAHRETLLDLLVFHVVEDIEDTMTASTMARIGASVRETGAGAVVIDPLGDVLAGDSNADLDVRASLRDLSHAVWKANPAAAMILVHHARTGKLNIAQAVGYDRGNYAKGSKAIYAACRAQINMAPADPDDTSKVVFSCGKCNDAKPFAVFGMRLEEGVYVEDATFDRDAWLADLEGKRSSARVSLQDIIDYLATTPDGWASQRGLADHFGVHESTIKTKVDAGQKSDFLRFRKVGKEKRIYSTGKSPARTSVQDCATDDLPLS